MVGDGSMSMEVGHTDHSQNAFRSAKVVNEGNMMSIMVLIFFHFLMFSIGQKFSHRKHKPPKKM